MSIDSPMDEISNAKTKVEDLESEINNIDKKLELIKHTSDYRSNPELVQVYDEVITYYKNLVIAYKKYIETVEKNI